MVRAVLDGSKFQTRRIVKLQPSITSADDASWRDSKSDLWRNKSQFARDCCPYGKIGDSLWVRETWRNYPMAGNDGAAGLVYRATSDVLPEGQWKPSIFMPRWASRITLEVTEVRVEQLKGISFKDCVSEGIECIPVAEASFGFRDYAKERLACFSVDDANSIAEAATASYRSLWESINGEGSWDENPWVWVISFKRKQAA